MAIELSIEYPVLKEKLEDEFLEMADYSISLFSDNIIILENGELKVTDYSKVNMSMLDLDAIRWWTGAISLDDYIKSISEYYKRSGN